MKIKSAIYTIFLAGLLLLLLFNCIEVPDQVVPTVKLATVTDITATTATSGGKITFEGSTTINLRGVCWSSTSKNPNISDSKTNDGHGSGSFVSSITGLLPGTSYTIRAYAINGAGRAYSQDTTFTTLFFLPVLTTSKLTVIAATMAIGGGNITNEGGNPMTVRGVCWSTNKNPTVSDRLTTDSIPKGVAGTGIFADSIKGLTPFTTYYIRAYATNGNGTAYGNEETITTLAMVPLITTTTATEVTVTTARCGGDIITEGGAAVTARGICWSTNPNPSISDNVTADGVGSGSFISIISGLTSGTTYYIRAYATNSVGTGYGNVLSFTTL